MLALYLHLLNKQQRYDMTLKTSSKVDSRRPSFDAMYRILKHLARNRLTPSINIENLQPTFTVVEAVQVIFSRLPDLRNRASSSPPTLLVLGLDERR